MSTNQIPGEGFTDYITREAALEAMQKAEAAEGAEPGLFVSLVDNVIPQRQDFTETEYRMVLSANGNCGCSEVKIRRSGQPVFRVLDDHADDSAWLYPSIEYREASGEKLSTSVSQAQWSIASGRVGFPRWFPRYSSFLVRDGKRITNPRIKIAQKTKAGR